MSSSQSFFKHVSLSAAAVVMATSLFASPVFAEAGKADAVARPAVAQQDAGKSDRININTADAQTLADRLNGVGLKKAEAIVAYRDQNGPFRAAEDIVNVAGIGESILAKNKDIISVN